MNLLRVLVNLFRFNRTNWKAVAGCFLAAAVFWLFNSLNKNYSTNVRFPLQFEFDRKKFVQSKPLPKDIYLNVSGNGWNLLRRELGVKLPSLVIPLERPADIKKIVGSTMPPLFSGQVSNLKINHVVTDTLYIAIELRDSARYKLVVDEKAITYKKGYGRISPVVVLPDSVQLDGPKSIFRHYADSLILVLPERKLSANFREEIEVNVTDNYIIKRNPPVVEVIFEVGEVVDEEKKIKLELRNSNKSFSITQETDSIRCSFQIPLNRISDFHQISTIRAVIDLSGFQKGQKKTLPVITGLPKYAQLMHVDSMHIKLY